ncbi:MAG: GIY-YIG nuclease family protein [Candidatus Paceibacterota bacterium]
MNSQSFKTTKILPAGRQVPSTPGVYFFLGKNKKILYIGKATSLKDRVKSYFTRDIAEVRSPLIEKMVLEAKSIEWKKTDSVLEALLLEADLIKKFRPPYNTKEKDDKSFNCIVITKEDFPRLLIVRKREINFTNLKTPTSKLATVFGPYPHGAQLKEALKIIRKIIPYRDQKCILAVDQLIKKHKPIPTNFSGEKLEGTRPCFNQQIGLCPGTCTGEISKKDYTKQIKKLELLLSGNIKKLSNVLEKEMTSEAKKKNFESAGKLRNTLYALTHIQDIALIKSDQLTPHISKLETPFRIESYDIAHLGGESTIGVMIVLEDGEINKNLYRKFNIKTAIKSDDTGALREVLTRRLNHPEWPYPSLFVIDGGKNQLNLASKVLKERNISIPVVSVLKDEFHKAKEILGDKNFAEKYEKEILLSNNEAHRFAITAHRKKRRKQFLV